MVEEAAGGLIRERLVEWAERLDVPSWGEPSEIRFRVERALAAKYDNAWSFRECESCGFTFPDVEELAECPGCGVRSPPAASGGEKMQQQSEETKPVRNGRASLKEKDERREDEKVDREQKVKEAEAVANKKLAELEKRIDELKGTAGRLEWDIGKHLDEIYRSDLWQASGEYKSFPDYVEKRFEFTRQTARSYMRIAEVFSREEAAELPVGHLHLLSKVPDEEERRALVERAKKDKPTFRELASEVKAKRAEAGLNTERAGMEDTVHVSVRLKVGVVAEGKWKKARGKEPNKRIGTFELGDNKFTIDDLGEDGFVIKLKQGD